MPSLVLSADVPAGLDAPGAEAPDAEATVSPAPDPALASPAFRADSLALGMLVMLAMTVVQRGLGFFRGMGFCRLLDDQDLGRWAMALGFITLVTPMLLLGMPGSLPRYVEHYRMRGHLRVFVRRLSLITAALGALTVSLLLAFPGAFGEIVFRDSSQRSLVASLAAAVAAIITYNFLNELVSGLRQVRVVSLMQFLQSLAFTVLGLGWLASGGEVAGLVLVFALATFLGTLPAWRVLFGGWSDLPRGDAPLAQRSMWQRILPYAAALWVMNLLSNAFELTDRYMLLHFSAGGAEVGQGSVGQYHSALLIPLLLGSLATMVAGVLTPYWSADWEQGRRAAVAERLRRILLALAVLFTCGAAAALWVSPWLFHTVLGGRYAEGLAVMPQTFVFCIWASVVTVGQSYLWVAERGRWVGVALALGLAVNVVLNRLLVPPLGLPGAVLATMSAHGIVMLGIWVALARCGYGLDRTSIWVSLLPATLLAGPAAALACTALTVAGSPHARQWIVAAGQSGRESWSRRRL